MLLGYLEDHFDEFRVRLSNVHGTLFFDFKTYKERLMRDGF